MTSVSILTELLVLLLAIICWLKSYKNTHIKNEYAVKKEKNNRKGVDNMNRIRFEPEEKGNNCTITENEACSQQKKENKNNTYSYQERNIPNMTFKTGIKLNSELRRVLTKWVIGIVIGVILLFEMNSPLGIYIGISIIFAPVFVFKAIKNGAWFGSLGGGFGIFFGMIIGLCIGLFVGPFIGIYETILAITSGE